MSAKSASKENGLGRRYGLEIRTAAEGDAAGLAELARAAGRPVPTRLLAERIAALQAEGGTVLIALEWGPPSGVVVLHRYRTLEADEPVAQITTLLVGPDERRRGIGRLLLKAAAQAARVAGCETLQLSVAVDRDGLSAFARANGFVEAETGLMRPLRKRASVEA